MSRAIKITLDLIITFFLVRMYMPLCIAIFMITPFTKEAKIFTIPIVEELLRLISIIFGGLAQYGYTLVFAVQEYIHYIQKVKTLYGYVPDGYYLYRTICVLVHFSLFIIQIYFFKKYQKTKRSSFIIIGFLLAITWHELYNYHIGKILLDLIVRY